mmetsp:Transcript_6911/g.14264  ORF Transcript_6911/g.14264 Transcript_6911/m.14264 type:complete len:365 (-) Transcript_6911:1664-2758(-)
MAVKLEDSNIAGIGSDMDQALREAAARSEEQFRGAGTVHGLEVWRIEKFEPVKVEKTEFGVFFMGDAYIVLRTYADDEGNEEKKYDLHFWLGRDSTQDERGAAAYFTVNLDDLLGGKPVQYREVQGSESEKFAALFPIIHTVEGGVDSGFTKVVPEAYTPKLLQIKGKNPVRVIEVPMSFTSLNHGDVFILDTGSQLIQWNSSGSGPFERNRAAEVANMIENLRGGEVSTEVVDGDDIECHETFWSLIGGRGDIAESSSDTEPPEVDPTRRLYQASHDGHQMKVSLLEEGDTISSSSINDNDIFIVTAAGKAYIFAGQMCSNSEIFYLKFHTEWILSQVALSPSACALLFRSDRPHPEWEALFG